MMLLITFGVRACGARITWNSMICGKRLGFPHVYGVATILESLGTLVPCAVRMHVGICVAGTTGASQGVLVLSMVSAMRKC